MTDPARGPTTEARGDFVDVPYECWCGEVFMAAVDAATREPRGGLYGPCPDCGEVCEPGGFSYRPDAVGDAS